MIGVGSGKKPFTTAKVAATTEAAAMTTNAGKIATGTAAAPETIASGVWHWIKREVLIEDEE